MNCLKKNKYEDIQMIDLEDKVNDIISIYINRLYHTDKTVGVVVNKEIAEYILDILTRLDETSIKEIDLVDYMNIDEYLVSVDDDGVITVVPIEDFCVLDKTDIFYIDMEDNPKKYVGKTVRFKARAMKSRKEEAEYFVPGRKAMTCCADDTRVIGYICKTPLAKNLRHGQWVQVTAKVAFEYSKQYRGKGPVFYASDVVPCEAPAEEMVYFN